MKYFILSFTIFISFLAKSQEIITDENVVLKKGIYKNFEEFKYNNPSIELNSEIVKKSRGYGFFGGEGKHIYYKIKIHKEEIKKVGKVFGYCDGKNIYISNKLKKVNTKFEFVQYLGAYSFFEKIITNVFVVKTGVAPNTSYFYMYKNKLTKFAIDINNGAYTELTNHSLKKIIEKDEAILNEFKKEDGKKDKIKQYLEMYCKQNYTNVVYNRDKRLTKNDADLFIKRNSNDTIDEIYYNRILEKFKKNPAIYDVKLVENFYKNGQKEFCGIVAKHYFNKNIEYPYKIGVWRNYYENGTLKEEIIYDILNKKISQTKFDIEGKEKIK